MEAYLTCVSEFVQVPSIAGREDSSVQLGRIHDLVRKWFPTLVSLAEIEREGDGRLLKLEGRGEGKPNLIVAHMDVVPAVGDWEFEPFGGAVRDGYLEGRGSLDMKGAAISMLWAMEEKLKAGWRPQAPLHIWLSGDEEIGGHYTGAMAKKLQDRGVRYRAVYDEGGTVSENWSGLPTGKFAAVSIAEKGSITVELTARSAGGHAADPPRNTPIARLAALINEIEENSPFKKELSQVHRDSLRQAAACLTGELREKCLAAAEDQAPYEKLKDLLPATAPMLGTTIAFTMMRGGTAPNIIPAECTVTANVRVGILESAEEAVTILRNLADRYNVELKWISGGNAAGPKGSHQALDNVCRMINTLFPGLPIITGMLYGGTDSKHFDPITEEIVRFTPISILGRQGAGVHGLNERITVDSLWESLEGYRILLEML